MKGIVWSFFDGSGLAVIDYAEAGYACFCFNADSGDHGEYEIKMRHPNITYVNCWIDENTDPAGHWLDLCHEIGKPDIIFAFPPCTHLAGSGGKHEREVSDMEQAVLNAKHIEELGNKYNCPWYVENPVGKMSTLWRKPDYYFDPYEYGGYLKREEGSFHPKMPFQDAYTKKTCLWAGNGFIMPEKKPVEHIGFFWGWKYLGGKSMKTKQLRSLTPRGFARAVFKFNHKI